MRPPISRARSWAARSACSLALCAAVLTALPSPVPAAAEPVAPVAGAAGAPAKAYGVGAARAALARLLPRHARQFDLVLVPADGAGDRFAVSGSAGRIVVTGTTPAVLLRGVHWYLSYTVGVDLGSPGDSLAALPARLPAPSGTISKSASVPHRFALNDTDDGYSGAYRDWAAYERQIDLLALHGVNEVFVQMGAEAAYHAAFQEFGYTDAELRDWIPGPAHQPWWLMQNMSSFGGPMTEQLIARRAALGKRIVDRLRELGMTPVLPGYFGTVPPGFTARNPEGRVVPQGRWIGFTRPDWLDPRGALFPKVASAFYRHQARLLGTTSMYKMDLLHEGGNPGDVPVGEAAARVMASLEDARPGATWVLLGWQRNPKAELLAGVDTSRLLVVDGLSDRYDNLDRETAWSGTPYAFGTIPNFGGHTTIGANTSVWTERFEAWRKKRDSALQGIAFLPEATSANPVTFSLFTELAWRDAPIEHADWFGAYAARRYGAPDPHAAKAWEWLRKGPYGTASNGWSESQDSLFTARPSLTVRTAASWGPKSMRYDAATVERALAELLQVAPALRSTDAYRFDLVDTARQALTNRSRVLLPKIKAAYEAKDLTAFRAGAAEWRRSMALLDEVLATDRRFLLGPWLEGARSWGGSDAERATLEFDARSLVTTWGHRAGSEAGLHDYANREWSGLVSGFYAPRWSTYLDALETSLVTGRAPAAIDWFAWENAWNLRRDSYPVTPKGDPVALATRVRDSLR
ncbi:MULTISPECIES: alpha-N-acetylglucosaminidase [Streptomyces]|uniref:Alpha-N-acetylglucosaminidase n=2 Tax=Streptomyces TaxID=1883 RepID=A0ABU4K202_9ACTN|nr:alpha-N-acetylglucosaminidase [Streptomyces roseolus]MDX2291780.1 alpha-N-acetylglucosaminidase [Streptomyces roseolus]